MQTLVREQKTAIAMGSHLRLGAESMLHLLTSDLLQVCDLGWTDLSGIDLQFGHFKHYIPESNCSSEQILCYEYRPAG